MGVAVVPSNNDGAGGFRLIVMGDSEWITDSLANRNPDNVLLALNLVDWLAQEDALASIRNKVVSSRLLLFESSTHKEIARFANVLGVPLFFIVIGLVRFILRRGVSLRTYSREK